MEPGDRASVGALRPARSLDPPSDARRKRRTDIIGGRSAASSAGAIGLMQLMPGTWAEMRALLGLGHDPQDPHDNILAGTAYLRSMYDRFGISRAVCSL